LLPSYDIFTVIHNNNNKITETTDQESIEPCETCKLNIFYLLKKYFYKQRDVIWVQNCEIDLGDIFIVKK
jgi:hypothetical protein